MTFPKRFDWPDAPAEILKLVDQLMPLLLMGAHPTLEILRNQLRVSRVRSVELSGVGFFAEFDVPVDAVTVTPPRIVGGDAEIALTGIEYGAGCVLFVDNGRLAMLEGYAKGGEPWLETTAVISVSDVISLEHALRREPVGEPTVSRTSRPLYPCPCCGFETLRESPPGTFEICIVCGWEDDNVQFQQPGYRDGANTESLRSHQARWLEANGGAGNEIEVGGSKYERQSSWRPLPRPASEN